MRAVISSRDCLKRECTAASTTSSSCSTSSGKSSVPSARMSHSVPARMRMRKRGCRSRIAATWVRSSSTPRPPAIVSERE